MERPPQPPAGDDRVQHVLYGETMGTRWRVDLCAPRHAPLDALHARLQARLDAIVAQMSTWEPDSDISRFNRAKAGHRCVLPEDFLRVATCAVQIARDSHGAFDPTVGPLVAAWGFGAQARGHRVPGDTELAALRESVGWQRLQLRAETRALLQPGGLQLDLSAIAKGYAVDALAGSLRDAGIDAALVDVGGELRGFGRKPDGEPWRVLVETGQDDDDGDPCVLALADVAVATSGTRWHRFELDGHEYAHTIDPRSGRPVHGAPAAVTVVADDAMHADAWATALTVLGVDDGHAFALAHGLAARFVARDGDEADRIRTTPAFTARCAA